MLFHLTVNGEPFCAWTGCLAHSDKARAARVSTCEYISGPLAILAAERLASAGVQRVAVALGDCPESGE